MQDSSYTHLVIIFLLLLIIVNLFILDLKVFTQPNIMQVSEIATSIVTPSPTPTTQPANNNWQSAISNLSCPNTCIALIKEATASIPISNLATSSGEPINVTLQNIIAPQRRETYIPLGTGSTSKSDWDNIVATETVIDPSLYGRLREAYFIVSLRNPTKNGQVEAQLYNVTDKRPVWGSQVVMGGESQTITSGKITIEQASKLYRVQLKNTLSYQVYLDNAKIRIVTE